MEVKRVLSSLEKDALLLDLIPIAFDDDLHIQVQVNGLFTDKVNSLSIIWNFILISFRFWVNRLASTNVCMMISKDWISFFYETLNFA